MSNTTPEKIEPPEEHEHGEYDPITPDDVPDFEAEHREEEQEDLL